MIKNFAGARSFCRNIFSEIEHGTGDEMNMTRVDDKGNAIDISKEIVYKLEVAANRYDLLCVEGFSQAIRSYLGISPFPTI
jgi:phenylalanyl-tRNA synthetase beta chain